MLALAGDMLCWVVRVMLSA